MNKIIDTYSLKQLISKAWNFGSFRRSQYKGKVSELSEVEANNIMGSLAAADPKYKVVFDRVLDLTTKNDLLLIYYKEDQTIFSREARAIIKNSFVDIGTTTKDGLRWKNFNEIVDRLNSPELLDYYINENITYAHYAGGFHRAPRSVIKERYGDQKAD